MLVTCLPKHRAWPRNLNPTYCQIKTACSGFLPEFVASFSGWSNQPFHHLEDPSMVGMFEADGRPTMGQE